jgi:pimeloyl-ACP methyl ester carboxylesterase
MPTVTSTDGTTIAYDRTGAGPTVILVDGALCFRAFGPMAALAALLAPHCTVVTYDRRGRGESGDTPPYAVAREVEDLAALLTAVGGATGVYGISSGAFLALAAARRLPNQIIRLALYEPPASLDAAAIQRFQDYRADLDALLAAGRRGDAVARFMRLVGAGLAESEHAAPQDAGASLRQTSLWPLFEAVAPTLAYDAAAMGDSAVPLEQAAGVAVSLLALAGGASPAWMQQAARAIAEAAAQGRYAVLEGQTHEVAAEALAPVLTEFFTVP